MTAATIENIRDRRAVSRLSERSRRRGLAWRSDLHEDGSGAVTIRVTRKVGPGKQRAKGEEVMSITGADYRQAADATSAAISARWPMQGGSPRGNTNASKANRAAAAQRIHDEQTNAMGRHDD